MGCYLPAPGQGDSRQRRVHLIRVASVLRGMEAAAHRGHRTCYVHELDLHPVPIDGCATGLTDKHGTPLYKPWLIAVSSASFVEELKNSRCDKTHEHGKIAGDETAKTAYYPRALCGATHRGLDAHELHRQGEDFPAALAEAGIRNPLILSSAAVMVCEPESSKRNPLTLSSAAVAVCDLAGGNQPSVDVREAQNQT